MSTRSLLPTPTRPVFRWDNRKRRAAALLAEGGLRVHEVAAEIGVKRQTLWDWHRHPDFKAVVATLETAFEAEARRYAFANRHRRIEALCRRAEEIEALFAARRLQRAEGDDPSVAAQIATGHVVKRPKYIGHGKYSERLYEYEADTALLREYRETLKQIAMETGQWSEKAEAPGSVAVGPLLITERRVRRLPRRATNEHESSAPLESLGYGVRVSG